MPVFVVELPAHNADNHSPFSESAVLVKPTVSRSFYWPFRGLSGPFDLGFQHIDLFGSLPSGIYDKRTHHDSRHFCSISVAERCTAFDRISSFGRLVYLFTNLQILSRSKMSRKLTPHSKRAR